jgi:ectoine hydroxylase-related dioxygenase (phytanoyl-CoA dioxygenase family)
LLTGGSATQCTMHKTPSASSPDEASNFPFKALKLIFSSQSRLKMAILSHCHVYKDVGCTVVGVLLYLHFVSQLATIASLLCWPII